MSIENNKEIEALDQLRKELEGNLDKELKEEEEIIQAIEQIASSLAIYGKANTEINGIKYMVKASVSNTGRTVLDSKGNKISEKQVVLIAANVVKASIMMGEYSPLIARVDFNYDLTTKGNLIAAVEGWVRHITGTIKPEMVE